MSKSIATVKDLQHRQEAPLTTPTDLNSSASERHRRGNERSPRRCIRSLSED
jgi:hypothetical protein